MYCAATVRHRQSGFTLVETLIVVFVIGLMTAIVVLTLPSSRSKLVTEAESFAAHVVAARDNAILQSRPMAVAVDAGGYGFEQRRAGEWQALGRKPFGRTDWRSGTHADISGRDTAQESEGEEEPPRLVFDPVGLANSDLAIRLVNGTDSVDVAIERNGSVRVGE